MSDADWVEDVRRWYFSARHAMSVEAGATSTGAPPDGEDALGYEAADPVLQAPHWPDAPLVAPAPPAAR